VIPALNHSGVLPPFLPTATPTTSSSMAPYRASLMELVSRYATGPKRVGIMQGFLKYREELRNAGIATGFQWIDGSFVENVEVNKGRPPNDVDIVTFADRPASLKDPHNWRQFVVGRPDLFSPGVSKSTYMCDAYFVDLGLPSVHLVTYTRFWFGLFSHQRDTFLWKGLVEIPLVDDDVSAKDFLTKAATHAP